MKNWKVSIYLVLTYIAMQIGSIYLGKLLIGYFQSRPGMSEQEAVFNGVAWSLFTVNLAASALFLLFIIPNKKYLKIFTGKKASIGNTILWGFLGFFLALGGQMLAATIETAMGVELGSENTAVLSEIARLSPIMLIPMVLFAPFLEEIVFRRVIFGGVFQKTNFWIAAIVSGLIFAVVHNELEHLLMYLMPGLVFSYLYYRTKRLLAPMIAHFLMNGFVAVVQLNSDKIQQLQDMKQAFILFGLH
ncbi:predicted metal-dependent membrane protease [Bacillus sp. OxB-1]|uniref:CPBP family intramembrane glutamic endopeptidase n=1 Tax=Bacillus sp. (strain OxB-1) TaxID=98228 RepID=UPI0005820398|nr:CPBP family intramembrane glutamic endopeptidase [Bacillus sp. OxB-1]BAQ08922.1 predicted metal-dependent membrane protease [Bacillus sp. OxB-1]